MLQVFNLSSSRRSVCLFLALGCLAFGMLLSSTQAEDKSDSLADEIKIGFLVKHAEQPWFQDEWRFAEEAAREKGFKLIKMSVPSGEQVMAAIDNLAAQKAQGFIICAPDVKLGAAILAKAQHYDLKVMSVDDRLVDGSGEFIQAIPHMGISAFEIGTQVAQAIVAEMKKRKWNLKEVGALRLSFDELPTAKDRSDGTVTGLKEAGFPEENVVVAPQIKADTESAFNAANIAILRNPTYKKWIAFGLNDEAATGALRAAEGHGFKEETMIAFGIGGSNVMTNEFEKKERTGFLGTVLINSRRHGYETTVNMYKWIKYGTPPPALILTEGKPIYRENYKQAKIEMGLSAEK